MSNKLGCDLRSFLQKKFGNELIIVDFSIEDLLPLGENFASTMLKISTRARKTKDSPIEEFSFVAKTNSASKSDWSIVFKKEVFMYNIVIPLYERIELESGVDERETIAHNVPVLFGYRLSSDPNLNGTDNDAVILLDNLKVQGYYVLDKKFGEYDNIIILLLEKLHIFLFRENGVSINRWPCMDGISIFLKYAQHVIFRELVPKIQIPLRT